MRKFRIDASKKIQGSYGRPNPPEICYRDKDADDRIVMWDIGMSQEDIDEQLAQHPSWYRSTADIDSCSDIKASSIMGAADEDEFEDPRITEADDLQNRVEDDFDYVITGIERLGREGLLDEAISLLNTLANTLDSAIGIIGNDFESGSEPEEEV